MAVSKALLATGMILIAVLAFAAGLYLSPMLFPPPAKEDLIWANIVKRGKIRVGSSPDWPPFESLDAVTGKFIGFEVELLETIAKRLNLTVEWKEMGFDLIVPEIKKGVTASIDLGVSGFSVRPDRLAVVKFTLYHSITEGQIIMLKSRRDAMALTEMTSLKNLTALGLSCGAQEGTTQQQELGKDAPSALRTYADYLVALEDMKRGVLDSIYAETPVTTEWIANAAGTDKPIVVVYRRAYYPVAWVANKEADTLIEKINSVLSEMIGNAEVDVLKRKWNC